MYLSTITRLGLRQARLRGFSVVSTVPVKSLLQTNDKSLSFHTTVPTPLPVRRRRRGQKAAPSKEEGEPVNPLLHTQVEDSVVFERAASDLLTKLETSVEHMKEQNDPFVVNRTLGALGEILTIDLGPKEGQYRIEVSVEETVFEYTSPISGKILYILSANTGEWVGLEDGHSFEGLFVRDIIRQCQGLPKL